MIQLTQLGAVVLTQGACDKGCNVTLAGSVTQQAAAERTLCLRLALNLIERRSLPEVENLQAVQQLSCPACPCSEKFARLMRQAAVSAVQCGRLWRARRIGPCAFLSEPS